MRKGRLSVTGVDADIKVELLGPEYTLLAINTSSTSSPCLGQPSCQSLSVSIFVLHRPHYNRTLLRCQAHPNLLVLQDSDSPF